MMDLSPTELADRLASVRTYTTDDLGAMMFRSKDGKTTEAVILVSIETRDAIISALKDWK